MVFCYSNPKWTKTHTGSRMAKKVFMMKNVEKTLGREHSCSYQFEESF